MDIYKNVWLFQPVSFIYAVFIESSYPLTIIRLFALCAMIFFLAMLASYTKNQTASIGKS